MIMDTDEVGSRVTQSLDSLWFYTNVFTTAHHHSVPSLTPPHVAPTSTHANGSTHMRDLQKPNSPTSLSLLNDQQQHGSQSAALEEEISVIPGAGGDASEILVKCGSGSRERKKKKKRDHRRKRKEWDKSAGVNGTLPPIDDEVAMKQHLRSWAYAVACILRSRAILDESVPNLSLV